MTISANTKKEAQEFTPLLTQIESTRIMLDRVFCRLSGSTLACVLAGIPSNDELDDMLGSVNEQLGVVNIEAKKLQIAAIIKSHEAEQQQAIQQTVFEALKDVVFMADNKLNYDVVSMNLGEYSLKNAQAGIMAAHDRVANMKKLLAVLSLVIPPRPVDVVGTLSWPEVKSLADCIVENIENQGSDQ